VGRRRVAISGILALALLVALLALRLLPAPADPEASMTRDAGRGTPPSLAPAPPRPPGERASAPPDEFEQALEYARQHPPRLGPQALRPHLSWDGDKVAFDHAGNRLASHGGGGLACFDRETRRLLWDAPVQGSVERLFFSPDDRFVYVAGGGREAILLRLDAESGRVDREYAGVEGSASAVLSPDGRTLAGFSSRTSRITFFDADTGEVLRTEEAKGFRLLPGPGGASLVARGGETGWVLHSWAPASPIPFPFETPPASLASVVACADPNLVVVVNREVDPPFFEAKGAVAVLRLRQGRWAVEKEIVLPSATMLQYPVLSDDGTLLATAGNGNHVRVFSVPDLELVGEAELPRSRASKLSIRGFSFTSDGGLLAAGRGGPLPTLFSVTRSGQKAIREIEAWTGHEAPVTRVSFSEDGSLFRTYDVEGTACAWERATVRLHVRWRAPPLCGFLEAGERAGRALCSRPRDPDPSTDSEATDLRVLDVENGAVVASAPVPDAYRDRGALWLPDGTLLLENAKRDGACVFDVEHARVLSTVRFDDSLASEMPHVVEGRTLWWMDGNLMRGDVPEIVRVDLSTGSVARVRAPKDESVHGSRYGFVPDGKHAFVAGSDLLLYDRATLVEVARRPLGQEPWRIEFSGDGLRYALLRGVERLPARERSSLPKTGGLLTVHETATGRPLFAAPLAEGYGVLGLDAQGRTLVFVGDDGRPIVWDLPFSR
jgi:WD40 repeat protein